MTDLIAFLLYLVAWVAIGVGASFLIGFPLVLVVCLIRARAQRERRWRETHRQCRGCTLWLSTDSKPYCSRDCEKRDADRRWREQMDAEHPGWDQIPF